MCIRGLEMESRSPELSQTAEAAQKYAQEQQDCFDDSTPNLIVSRSLLFALTVNAFMAGVLHGLDTSIAIHRGETTNA